MQQQEIIYRPIGVIHSPHTIPSATPIQPVFSKGIRGTVVLEPEYVDGLLDLEEFSHIFLIYHFHRSPGMKLRLCPYLQDAEHGIFATRAPTVRIRSDLAWLSCAALKVIFSQLKMWTFSMARRSWISNPMRPVLTPAKMSVPAGRNRCRKLTRTFAENAIIKKRKHLAAFDVRQAYTSQSICRFYHTERTAQWVFKGSTFTFQWKRSNANTSFIHHAHRSL